ncbi:tyrosine--tRNA ligase [Candidatus Daviesbacteria bacterium]|nr:tyrosine--tRNA ligase [Candidatus Daviesbacteria bacterium]
MTNEEKFKLITRNLEEVLTEEELKQLIESGTPLKHYIGFEISGKVHLGTGLAVMQKVKDLALAGAQTTIFLADWHTWLNKKLDGTLETARKMAREYFEEGLKAAYLCVGGQIQDLKFVLGNELYNQTYWAKVIGVAKATTISRMLRSTDIMGRLAGDSSEVATLFYPAMQAADIFQMGVNIAHAGTDQRNVHVVAREAAKKIGFAKPVAIHHHLLKGLLKPHVWPLPKENRDEMVTAMKMSKSKPDSAVFIHDEPDEIKRKVNNAFCPEGETDYNPILDWTKYLVMVDGSSLIVHRKKEFGGDITYTSYEELEIDYAQKKLHPQDLKEAVAEWLIKKLEPARNYFEDPKRKQALEEIERLTTTH